MLNLNKEIQYIKGVGPSRAKSLNKLGVQSFEDLITYFPRAYEDRSKPKKIAYLKNGEDALIEAICVSKMSEIKIKRNMTLYKLIVRDDTATCQITWFNQSYLKNKFKLGERYKFFGKVKRTLNQIEIMSPVFDEKDTFKNTGKIIPIYPTIYELSQNTLRQIMENALKEIENIEETLPEYLIKKYELCNIKEALQNIHFPKSFEAYNKAKRRLVFEELFILQLALLNLKDKYTKNNNGIAFNKDVKMSEIICKLPFKLTNAQTKVLEEIERDMESSKSMNRLLQGDVGSGKTAVSIVSAYKAVKSRISSCSYGTYSNFSKATFRKL